MGSMLQYIAAPWIISDMELSWNCHGLSIIKHRNIGKLGSLWQDPHGISDLMRAPFLMIFCGKNAL